MKEREMSSLCPGLFFIPRKGERDLMSFADLDLTLYTRAELPGRRRSEGAASFPDRVEATMGVSAYMADSDGR